MSLSEPIQICRDLNPTAQPRLPVSQLWAHCLLLCHVFWLLATVSALGRHKAPGCPVIIVFAEGQLAPHCPRRAPQGPGV